MSVPNQKIVKIKKPKYKENFLQIGKDEWLEAFDLMSPTTFKLYLYLSGNSDGFKLELSQVAVKNAIGISRASYDRGVKRLRELGYLVQVGGNTFVFHTKRQPTNTFYQNWEDTQNCDKSELSKTHFRDDTEMYQNCAEDVQNGVNDASELTIEIDNIDKRDIIDNKRELSIDYSYLNEKVCGDGFVEDKGIWMDNILGEYWDLPKEEQKRLIAEHYDDFGFTYDDADYIVENILLVNEEDSNYA